ncbi:hypothetical protein [Blastococcus sp. LR1]|uniref:hypothetical protein n=1 Tax=Blastococcus sp. LR1 TaxID=2877000 RepID=UPI001CCDC0E5|nr:hypothetical protein [Blastococcus sp. LR1]MCA0145656.1 hypothetical protein [Blastococcus sp. LR1]
MLRTSRLAPALLIPALLLPACGGEESADTADRAPSAETSSSAPATSEAPAAMSDPIPVGETISDPVLGHQISVKNVIRNFPVPADSPMADKELVLVEIEATAGSEFYGGLYGSEFRLVEPGEEIPSPSTGAFDETITAEGLTPWVELDRGATGTGWLAFFAYQPGVPGLELQYKRSAATVMGSDQQIEEELFTVPLPDPTS